MTYTCDKKYGTLWNIENCVVFCGTYTCSTCPPPPPLSLQNITFIHVVETISIPNSKIEIYYKLTFLIFIY